MKPTGSEPDSAGTFTGLSSLLTAGYELIIGYSKCWLPDADDEGAGEAGGADKRLCGYVSPVYRHKDLRSTGNNRPMGQPSNDTTSTSVSGGIEHNPKLVDVKIPLLGVRMTDRWRLGLQGKFPAGSEAHFIFDLSRRL